MRRLTSALIGSSRKAHKAVAPSIAPSDGPSCGQGVNDVTCEDLGRCTSLTSLDLCACPKVSDAGLKHLGMLAARQMKAHAAWQAANSGSGALRVPSAPPATLSHLELGGMVRMSDSALLKLLARARQLRTLDLRGCEKLTSEGLRGALTGAADALIVPELSRLTLTRLDAATDDVVASIQHARPSLQIVT